MEGQNDKPVARPTEERLQDLANAIASGLGDPRYRIVVENLQVFDRDRLDQALSDIGVAP